MPMTRAYLVGGLACVIIGLAAAPAAAHAELVRSDPSANAVLHQPPAEAQLWFTEQIEAGLNPTTLIDAAGATVPGVTAAVAADDVQRLRVRLPTLKVGHYMLRWRVISADGHPVQGAIPFQVGLDAGPAPDFARLASAQAAASLARIPGLAGSTFAWPVARWLTVASALLLAGAAMLPSLVWPGAGAGGPPPAVAAAIAARYPALLAGGAAGFALGNLGLLALQAATQAELPLSGVWRADVIGQVAMETRFGLLILTRVGLVAIALAAARWLDLRERWAGFGFGAILLLTLSLGGHAVAQPGIAPIIADWLHLAAVAPWIGGLAVGVLALLPALASIDGERRRAALAVLVPRFTRLAALSVALAAATGLYASVLHVPEWSALIGTAYGRALLVKLALIVPLLALGLYNSVLGRGRLQRPSGGAAAVVSFRRAVWAEVVVAVGVLAATAVLIGLPPARQAAGAGPAAVMTAQAGDMQVNFRLEPNRPGYNSLEITVQGPDGVPVTDLNVVTFGYMPEHRHMTPEVEVPSRGGGRYRLDQLILMAGRMQHHVVIRRGQDEQHVLFEVVTPE